MIISAYHARAFFFILTHFFLTSPRKQRHEITKFEVCVGLLHTTRKACVFLKIPNLFMSVSSVRRQIVLILYPERLEKCLMSQKKVNLYFSSSDGYRNVFSRSSDAIHLPIRKGIAKHMLLLLLL